MIEWETQQNASARVHQTAGIMISNGMTKAAPIGDLFCGLVVDCMEYVVAKEQVILSIG